MGHAYISKSKSGAEVLAVCSAPAAELVEQAESKAKLLSTKSSAAAQGQRRKAR